MSKDDLGRLYQQGRLHKGSSREVDGAIADFFKVTGSTKGADLERIWQKLLGIILLEYPNICTSNLVQLELILSSRGLHQENLVICCLLADLNPASYEEKFFLGNAYREVGNLESALEAYRNAYELIMDYIAGMTPRVESSHPLYLDAADYLTHMARTENDLGHRADAFTYAVKAFTITKDGNSSSKQVRVLELLQQIFLGMQLNSLATQCYNMANDIKLIKSK